MFTSTLNKGFHMEFQNGYTISVQFGLGNYCENYCKNNFNKYKTESKDAEIAIFKSGSFVTGHVFNDLYNEELFDEVVGHLSTDKVAELIYKVSKLEG